MRDESECLPAETDAGPTVRQHFIVRHELALISVTQMPRGAGRRRAPADFGTRAINARRL
jgi:hypothetical protein